MDGKNKTKEQLMSELKKLRQQLKNQKEIEDALNVAQISYKALFDGMSNGVAVYEARNNGNEFVFSDFNKAGEKIDNIKKEVIIGKSIHEVFPHVKEFGLFDVFQRVWRTGNPERHPVTKYVDDRICGWRENYVYKLPDGKIVAIYEDISELKKEEKERLRLIAIIEATPDFVAIVDSDNTPIYHNRAALDILGMDYDELHSSRQLEQAHPDWAARIVLEKGIPFAIQHGVWCGETALLHKDGHEIPVSQAILVHKNPDGTIDSISTIMRDITQCKQAEKDLQISEEKYRTLFELDSDALFMVDEESADILDANAIAAQMYGYSKEELLQLKATDLSDEPEKTKAAIKLNGKTHVPIRCHKKKDGTVFPVEIAANDFTLQGMKINISSIRDITERMHEEKLLRSSEIKYRRVFENSISAIYIYDVEKNFIDSNQAGLDLLGYSRDELMKMSIPDVDAEPQAVLPAHNQLLQGESLINYEHKLKDKDGKILTVLNNSTAIQDDDGNIIGMQSILMDISRREQLEAQLRQAQKMEAIGVLTGGIAHEFNNLLVPILGFTELLMSEKSECDPDLADLKQIQNAGNIAKDLILQMVAFGRRSIPKRESVQLECVVEDTIRLIKNTIPSNISINKEVEVGLPPILGLPNELQQVLLNLCINAGQAMPAGGVLIIRLRKEGFCKFIGVNGKLLQGNFISLSVQDTGCGMIQNTIDHMFDPFFSTKDVGQGSGLGLSVVQGVVEQHEGRIDVDSALGKGSTIQVYLPVVQNEVEPAAVKTELLSERKERILLIDDEPMVIDLAKSMLEQLGYKVTAFFDCVEALTQFADQSHDFDLVMMDYGMPKMNGKQLAEQLKIIRPDIAIILITSYGDLDPKEEIGTLGVDALLTKPFPLQVLSEIVRKVLNKKGGKGVGVNL